MSIIQYNVEDETNFLITEEEVQKLIDTLNFYLVKPSDVKVTLRTGFTMIVITMSNGDKIQYELIEETNRRIFHFGSHQDDTFPYTESEGKDGALEGFIRIYPYYIQKQFKINNGLFRRNILSDNFNAYIQQELQKRYTDKLKDFKNERVHF